MSEWLAGNVTEFEGDDRKIVSVDGREVVVFRWGERFLAYENECLHMGGPVGEGLILGKVEAVLGPNKEVIREHYPAVVFPTEDEKYDAIVQQILRMQAIGRPVLVGVDVASTYCYLLSLEGQRDGVTWGVRLLELQARGFAPRAVIGDGGSGLAAGQESALPEVPRRG